MMTIVNLCHESASEEIYLRLEKIHNESMERRRKFSDDLYSWKCHVREVDRVTMRLWKIKAVK
jgi:alpha-galactosidase